MVASINSPGGSAVQSAIMANKLKCFAESKNVPFYTFTEDLAASGGYYILCVGKLICLIK